MPSAEWDLIADAGANLQEINEYLYKRRLTDGLPVIPPEPHLVEAAVAFTGRDPHEVIATVAPAQLEATVEKIAANAVMAGCEPKHLPVVIAAVEAVTDPTWALYVLQATTNPGGPFLVINGPCRDYLDMNYGPGIFGPGFKANATIGRALRLILLNIGGARPGELDLATHGFPGKYTMCIAENEAENPWEPYHVERGWNLDDNVLTASFVFSTVNVLDNESSTADGLMQTLIGSHMIQGTNNFIAGGSGQVSVILGPEWAYNLADGGYTKQSIRERIWNEATIPLADFSAEVAEGMTLKKAHIENNTVHVTSGPQDIHIIVSGGAGRHTTLTFGLREEALMREIKFPTGLSFS